MLFMSSALRNQLNKENSRIRVTVVSPAVVKTSMSSGFSWKLKLGQFMLVEDFADAVPYAIATPAHVNKLEHEVNNSGASGSVKGYVCDVGSWSQVDAVFKAIEEDLGAISVLVNNAGVFKPIIPTDMDLENTKIMLDTNLNGVLYCTKAGLAVMKNHSINDGYIINLSSIAAHTVPLRVVGMYAAAKHAITVMSFALRSQLKLENSRIRVTVVSPALVQTAMTSGLIGNLKLGQYMLAEDVADAIAYAIATPTHVNISEMILENVDDFPVPVV